MRPTWEQYALNLAEAAKTRSEDPYMQVGACALRWDHSVAATGYNGVKPGETIDWSDRDKRRPFVIHAEKNCLRYVRIGECELLACTLLPCPDCLAEIARMRIPRVVYKELYTTNKEVAQQTFEDATKYGIDLKQI